MVTANAIAETPSSFQGWGDARPSLSIGILPARGTGSLAIFEPALLPPPRPTPERGSRERQLHDKLCRTFRDAHDGMLRTDSNGALAIAKELVIDLLSRKRRTRIPHEPRDAIDPGLLLTVAISQLDGAMNDGDEPAHESNPAELRNLLKWLTGYRTLQPENGDVRRRSLHELQALVSRLVERCC